MFCGSEFSASLVLLSCPWYYFILKAHHHRLTFQWPNFYPVIDQCLPHKNCPVCNPFLIQTPVCLLLSVSCSPQLLSKHLFSPFSMKHQLFSHHPPQFVNAHILCNPWIQPTTVRLISAFKTKELGLSKRQDPGSRPTSYMTQQFDCTTYLVLLTKASKKEGFTWAYVQS